MGSYAIIAHNYFLHISYCHITLLMKYLCIQFIDLHPVLHQYKCLKNKIHRCEFNNRTVFVFLFDLPLIFICKIFFFSLTEIIQRDKPLSARIWVSLHKQDTRLATPCCSNGRSQEINLEQICFQLISVRYEP